MIQPPITRLLFPFVTNQAGYNTSLVITNSGEASGNCVLNFSGNISGGMDGPRPMKLEKLFLPGVPVRLELADIAPGFQGCIRADCSVTRAAGTFVIEPGPALPTGISGTAFTGAVPEAALDVLDKQTYGHARKCGFLQHP
jgi:hypothetical protein